MDIAKLLQEALAKKAEEVPEGWYTMKQLTKMTRKSETRTRDMIRELIGQGLVEKKTFYIKAGEKLYPTPHYKELKQ